MPKRKRSDIESSPVSGHEPKLDRGVARRRFQVQDSLEKGKRALHQALKFARGFERQKLGRRRKEAGSGKTEADIARLDGEVKSLKNLDLEVVAEAHLAKQIQKLKRFREAPAYPDNYIASLRTLPLPDDATKNVVARLYAAKQVRQAVQEVINGIYTIMEFDNPTTATGNERTMKQRSNQSVAARPDDEPVAGKSSSSVSSWNGFSDNEDYPSQQNEDALERTVDSMEWATRIVGSSDSESNLSDENPHIHSTDNRSFSVSSPSLSPEPNGHGQSSSKGKVHEPPNASTYLPTLMGGYWSGSEDDASEAEDVKELHVRKNRRGQRARQAIWDKKYGKNANHLKKERMNNGRDDGWDLKRGAVDEQGNAQGKQRYGKPERRHGPSRRSEYNNTGTRRNGIAMSQGEKKMPEKIHPSWEAARKAKEQARSVKFEGRKVVFD